MTEIAISMHSKCHAEIHYFCARAQEAQNLLNFRHIYIPEKDQGSIYSGNQLNAVDICREAYKLKRENRLSRNDLLILMTDSDLYDHEDNEYFYITNFDYSPIATRCPRTGVMSLYYLNPDSSFRKEGRNEWKGFTEAEKNSVTSQSILLLILAAISTLLVSIDSHDETLGCIMDYCQKPSDVLTAVRDGLSFCEACSLTLKKNPEGRAILKIALDLKENPFSHNMSKTKTGVKGVASTLEAKIETGSFDVFLCHNSADKPMVKKIGEKLKERGILPWLDEWELRPGFPWQKVLEEQIEKIKSAAVFVGKNGMGPWQDMELDGFIRQFVRGARPVIPVILSNNEKTPHLPVFLSGMTWVDFRKKKPDPLELLIWGITGDRGPGRK